MIAVCVEALAVEGRPDRARPGRPSSRSARRCRRRLAPGLTAVSASRTSAASLSTEPSAASGPQWPWSVYSHRHVSAIVDERQLEGADPPEGVLDDPVVGRCFGAERVLRLWQAEEDDAADAELGQASSLLGRHVGRQPS